MNHEIKKYEIAFQIQFNRPSEMNDYDFEINRILTSGIVKFGQFTLSMVTPR